MAYDYDELFPGRFLKAGEFKGRDATLTISGIAIEELPDKKGERARGIISFKETKKQLVLNRTNGECLKGMFGRDTGKWIGRRVTFYPATVEAFGAPQLAIRVRGSPELPRDMQVTCKVGRQGDVKVTMRKTGQKANGKAAAAPAPAPEPSFDPTVASPETVPEPDFDAVTGEVPFDS